MRKGQLLIEVMIAVSVILIALVGLVQVANRSVNNSGAARRQAEATTYGMEAVEWVVAQKDLLGWDGLVGQASVGGTNYCFSVSPPDVAWPGQGGCGAATLGNPVQYTRLVRLTSIPPNEVSIVVTVTWNEGGRTMSSKQSRTVGRY